MTWWAIFKLNDSIPLHIVSNSIAFYRISHRHMCLHQHKCLCVIAVVQLSHGCLFEMKQITTMYGCSEPSDAGCELRGKRNTHSCTIGMYCEPVSHISYGHGYTRTRSTRGRHTHTHTNTLYIFYLFRILSIKCGMFSSCKSRKLWTCTS